MATKTCPNGHIYDSAIYENNCPFCPSATGSTKINLDNDDSLGTRVLGDTGVDPKPTETIGIGNDDAPGGGTVIRHKDPTGKTSIGDNRRLVGILVSYSANPAGEVYKVFEGRTTIGRDRTCDIPFPNDSHMSSKHLLIQYIEAKGVFRAQEFDKGSANGSYVNGKVYVLGDVIDLKNNDIIILGGTKFVFLTIPEI